MVSSRKVIGILGIAALLSAVAVLPAGAQDASQATLSFKPHCILQDRNQCPSYEVADAEHLQTMQMRSGDIVDVDIVLTTMDPQAVSTVRSWLKYDPTQLEARSVEIFADVLPQPIPGEQSIDAVQGLIKIGGGTDGKLNATEARVARVTFRVINTTVNSNIFFENYKQDGTGETAVLKETDGGPVQLMQVNPTILTVRVSTTQVAPPAVPAQTGNTQPTVTNPANPNSGAFQLLQVQNLKLTSSNQSIFVGWDPLPSADIDGYNVYYGTVSGKYIQRRSLEEDNSSLILRDLEPNSTYYVAVRAYSKKGEESTFSHEESVRVGKPESSTSPLNQQPGKISSNPPAETNPIETRNGTSITGETGLNTGVVAVILFSAAIGTALAWRRQFATSPVSSR